MKSHEVILKTGKRNQVAESEMIGIKGELSSAVADTEIVTTSIEYKTGLIIVEDSTNNDSALFNVYNDGGTGTSAKVSGGTVFTATKDTAASINVFYDATAEAIQIQNLTGGAIDLTAKALV